MIGRVVKMALFAMFACTSLVASTMNLETNSGQNLVKQNEWTNYQVGSVYEYSFNMNLDIVGSNSGDDGMVASDETSQVSTQGIVEYRCLGKDESNYLMEMEIKNVGFSQSNSDGINEQIGIRNQREINSEYENKRARYIQNNRGHIVNIVDLPDSQLVWLYKGLINAMQTHVADLTGRWMVASDLYQESGILFSDTTGIHTVDVTMKKDNNRDLIELNFDEDDYHHFADKRVDKDKIDMDGLIRHWKHPVYNVHDEIHVIHNASFQPEGSSELGAQGSLKLKLKNVGYHSTPNNFNFRGLNNLKSLLITANESIINEEQISRTKNILNEFLQNPADIYAAHLMGIRMSEYPEHITLIKNVMNSSNRRGIMLALVCANNLEAQNIMIQQFLNSDSEDEVKTAIIMSRMFKEPTKELLSNVKMASIKANFEDIIEDKNIIVNSDSFDKQKSGSWSKTVGPKDLHVDLAASYFAGTDFTACGGGSATDLNVKVGATASATASIFGHSKSVIDLNAWYVILAGQTVQNSYSLAVFGHTVTTGKVFQYEGQACPPHVTKNIWTASPGFSVTYTMVVVAVPVQFTAGVTAQLNLAYGYDICPQDLKASIDLEPGVTVVASATAQVSLVLAHAGITLAGSINQQVRPTAFLNMNGNCKLGAKVDLVSSPTTLRFYGFYGYRSCRMHHWHLSCGWHDQSHDFWSWQGTGGSSTVWSDTCYFNRHSSPMFSCGLASKVSTLTKKSRTLGARFDTLSLVKGLVSKFSSDFHWVTCAGDAYKIYTDTMTLMHQLENLRWGQWKSDIGIIKNSLGEISNLLHSADSAITACDLTQISEEIAKACAKLSGWIGEIDEAVTVATHIVDFVQDSIDIVDGIEKNNWFEVGQGIGGLIQLLA